MTIDQKSLQVKTSTIPGAGKGLFTKVFIPKDSFIIEYTGDIMPWKDVKHEWDNDYIYYVNAQHVINARHRKDSIARYINDANGFSKIKGFSNNCFYKKIGTAVWVQAVKDIPARSELFVSYGRDYWERGRLNAEIMATEKTQGKPKNKKG
ncbi:MAG: SET domain-containing protein [Chitinophagaceae bacterium]|nr:MAG: SET domain-containing protein [Chitinophagaceae bacterium]